MNALYPAPHAFDVSPPRRLVRAWRLVRDGLPSIGRYRRYALAMLPMLTLIWFLTAAYLVFAPARYESKMTLILPGSGVGGSMNVESIGQASAVTSSAFSSATLSPTENYKRLLATDLNLRAAARLSGDAEERFPLPTIKLTDQTNIIDIAITGPSPRIAQRRARALRAAFLADLDRLRGDEAASREAADRARIKGLEDKVRNAQRRLLAFQGATGLVSIDQFSQRISALDTLQDRQQAARATVRQQQAQNRDLTVSLGISTASARSAMVLKADPLFQSLLARYAASMTQGTERVATLGNRHLAVVEARAANDSLRAALVQRGRSLTGLSPSVLLSFADLSVADGRARMFETLVIGNSQEAGARAALAQLGGEIASQEARSKMLVGQAATLADLVRDQRIAEAVFSSALARLDTNKSDPFASYPLVQTLEAPSLPRARSSPSTVLALAGAVAASLLLLIGFGLTWLRQPIIHKLLPKA